MNGKDIVLIAEDAFKKKPINKEIRLPERLTRIGNAAFEGCGIKGDLHLPETVNWIEPLAFIKNKITSVKLPDNLGPMGWRAFEENEIETLDLGALNKIQGSRWFSEKNYEIPGLISYQAFRKNKIKKLIFPATSTVWGLGNFCFAENEIETLTIPARIENLYYGVFRKNKNLTSVSFEDSSSTLQIDGYVFAGCNITGTLVLPDRVSQLNSREAFADNKITKVVLPTSGIYSMGWDIFARNPIEEVENFRPGDIFDSGEFSDTKALKNFSFDNFHSDKDHEGKRFQVGIYEKQKWIPEKTFKNGLLKSLEIPKHITKLYNSAFEGNAGWKGENSPVALYRVDGNGNYVTDNIVEDGNTYVINPVLVEVKLLNQYNQPIEKDVTLNGSITRKKGTEDTELLDIKIERKEDRKNFKLGDNYSFKVPQMEGLKLLTVDGKPFEGKAAEQFINDAEILSADLVSVSISGENGAKEEKYDDTYKVGYMKKVITLIYHDQDAKPNTGLGDTGFVSSGTDASGAVSSGTDASGTVSSDAVGFGSGDITTDDTPIHIPAPPVIDSDTSQGGVVLSEETVTVEDIEVPESPALIVPMEEEVENLEIDGDETPKGKTEIDSAMVGNPLLAKTGGLRTIFFFAASLFAILLSGFLFLEIYRKRKEKR